MSVLDMLKTTSVEPKIRKSALIQVSVMMTDVSLHKLFIAENGLQIILEIFASALVIVNYSLKIFSMFLYMEIFLNKLNFQKINYH